MPKFNAKNMSVLSLEGKPTPASAAPKPPAASKDNNFFRLSPADDLEQSASESEQLSNDISADYKCFHDDVDLGLLRRCYPFVRADSA